MGTDILVSVLLSVLITICFSSLSLVAARGAKYWSLSAVWSL